MRSSRACRTFRRADSRATNRQGASTARKLLIGAVAGVIAAMAVREFPALRREIKIWRM